jgi:hypothetical protein
MPIPPPLRSTGKSARLHKTIYMKNACYLELHFRQQAFFRADRLKNKYAYLFLSGILQILYNFRRLY